MKNRFKIDFFELCFLAEACIPPTTIVRAMVLDKLTDVYYHQMPKQEREKLFKWLYPKLDMEDTQCLFLYNRFNPDNQYRVHTSEGVKDCFLCNNRYYVSSDTYISEEFITKVEKL